MTARRLTFHGAMALTLLLTGCVADKDAGRLYLAEREIYQADRAYRDLTIRPQDVENEAWAALAERFEKIGKRFETTAGTGSPSTRSLRILCARSLFAAAQIRSGIGDSTTVDEIYRGMAGSYADLPEVSAEVALAQAGLAEGRGDLRSALGLYRRVIDLVPPDPMQPGAPSAVLQLPVRVARMSSVLAGYRDENAYAEADQYYQRVALANPGSLVQVDAEASRAELAADRGDWSGGIEILGALEAELRAKPRRERDPAAVMLTRAELMTRAGANADSVQGVLSRLLGDFPKSKFAPRALIALAANANERNRVEDALAYLDRIPAEHKEDEDAGSQALLLRARLLESRDRWPEARETLRTLTSEHPLSEAGMAAPMLSVEHSDRAGDEAGTQAALADAERYYRDFIERYPPSQYSLMARERLVQVCTLRNNDDAAITEMVKLGEDLKGSERGARWFASAAAMAYGKAKNTERALEILDRMSQTYASTEPGTWAANEARRIREAATP